MGSHEADCVTSLKAFHDTPLGKNGQSRAEKWRRTNKISRDPELLIHVSANLFHYWIYLDLAIIIQLLYRIVSNFSPIAATLNEKGLCISIKLPETNLNIMSRSGRKTLEKSLNSALASCLRNWWDYKLQLEFNNGPFCPLVLPLYFIFEFFIFHVLSLTLCPPNSPDSFHFVPKVSFPTLYRFNYSRLRQTITRLAAINRIIFESLLRDLIDIPEIVVTPWHCLILEIEIYSDDAMMCIN